MHSVMEKQRHKLLVVRSLDRALPTPPRFPLWSTVSDMESHVETSVVTGLGTQGDTGSHQGQERDQTSCSQVCIA